jgi:glucose/arabinose dehydrogenase
MDFSPTGELWVLEQTGRVKVVRPDATTHTALTLGVDSRGERGLLGIAFDPTYDGAGASTDYVYLYHTLPGGANNRITRYEVTGAGSTTPTLTDPVTILNLDPLSGATNHNGGAIHFGPDGLLYVAVGDNANGAHAQTLTSLHGKMLRINPDGTAPTSNPFFMDDSTVTDRDFIWALGLRNPFTFSFQPGSGRMFINDVGQGTWEEINEGGAGRNFGWATTEGDFNQATFPNFTRPVYAYSHGGGGFQGYAITGGAFYNPTVGQFPSQYVGDYFFADYGNSWINVRDSVTGVVSQFATGASNPVDLKVGADGSLSYLTRGTGRIMRIRSTASQAPAITQQPDDLTRGVSESASFSVAASGTAPLTYRWQQLVGITWTNLTDGGRIVGAATATLTISNLQSGDAGQYRAVVTNAVNSAESVPAVLTVTVNEAPTATIAIDSGLADGLFHAGQAIMFSGIATDPEDGPLAASQFTWRVDYITSIDSGNPVVRPFVQPFSGVTGSNFTPATTGPYTLADVAYRITLVVEDSQGRTTTVTRDLVPAVSTLTVQTSPVGRQFTLDAQPFATPQTFQSVVGFERPLGVSTSQQDNSFVFTFDSWSDSGAATHTVVTPIADTTYTATFTSAPIPNGLTATYFDNSNFTGTSITRIDPAVDFNWGRGSPDPSLAADTFSVRWTGSIVPLFTQTYTFRTTSDDGVRLWVNNRLIINNWTRHAPTVNTGRIALVAGERSNIRMEYYEHTGGAVARLEWQSPSQLRQVVPESQLLPTSQPVEPNGLNATYYNNSDFTGTTFSRIDAMVNFNWGTRSPHASIGADTFSVRWTGSIAPLSTGRHTFFTTSNDGVRLWVNNQLIINNWTRHGTTVNSGQIDLVAGQRYDIRMEYFEHTGTAVARLEWQTATVPRQVVPTSRLFPTAAPAMAAFAFATAERPVASPWRLRFATR